MKLITPMAVITAAVSALSLGGCASTGDVTPQYIAPSTYQSYDCNSLNQEFTRVNRYINATQNQQSGFSTSGVGVGVSAGRWGISPNISFGVGRNNNNQGRDAKLSRLFGERDAIVQSARIKQCSFANGIKIYGE